MKIEKDLKKWYLELFNKPKEWDYYKQKPVNPIESKYFKSFIDNYINASDKSDGNPFVEPLEIIEGEEHVFSVFFLGIILYENCDAIKKEIDKKVNSYQKKNKFNVTFNYMWFIIALFHDTGKKLEEDNKYKHLEFFKQDFGIENKLKSPVGIPKQIKENWIRYFYYRLNYMPGSNHKKPDHGILGGMHLYDKLCKTYKHIQGVGEKINDGEYKYNELIWTEKGLNIFNLCSWVILAHNIYYLREDVDEDIEIDLYKCSGLDSLILERIQPSVTNLKQHPFLFLLCLVDTIEPSKQYENKDLLFSLDKIKMEVEHNKIHLKFKKPYIENRFKNICTMNNWLRIKTNHKIKELEATVELTILKK